MVVKGPTLIKFSALPHTVQQCRSDVFWLYPSLALQEYI